ncbi:NUDIX hydrolase [Candidatus Microgenomates bacterium]|nr:NUDIX hydrolase [Candidatus Microgenomates bacterium]
MKKNSYTSGFLLHSNSQQILLQQNSAEEQPTWNLLGGMSEKNFQKVVAKLLNLKLQPKAVVPVYDYSSKGKKHFISYAEVDKLSDFPASKTSLFKWFTAKEISKLPLSSQTKQDIIVGRRVIDSQIRRDAGEQTIG